MALKPVITITPSADQSVLLVKDVTGAYDSVDNPGGYGTPNQNYSGFFLLLFRALGDTGYSYKYYNADALDGQDVATTGIEVTLDFLGITATQVYQFKYIPIETVQFPGFGTILAGTKSINKISGVDFTTYFRAGQQWVFIQDRTTIPYGNGGEITGQIFTLDAVAATTVSTIDGAINDETGAVLGGYEADLKVALDYQAQICVSNLIGRLAYATTDCPECASELSLLTSYLQAVPVQMNQGDYAGANNLIKGVLSQCGDCLPCKNCN